MNVTIISYTAFSDVLKCECTTQLAYPMMDADRALSLFMKEYPEYTNMSNFSSHTFDVKDNPTLYKAFEDSGCVRFWRVY